MPLDIRKAAELAHPVFEENGWTYYDGAPSVDRLEDTIESLVESTLSRDEGEIVVSSGRFIVFRYASEKDEEISISLELANTYDQEFFE